MNVSLTSLQLALHVDPVVQDDLYHSCKSSHILSSQQFVSSLTSNEYYLYNFIMFSTGFVTTFVYKVISHIFTLLGASVFLNAIILPGQAANLVPSFQCRTIVCFTTVDKFICSVLSIVPPTTIGTQTVPIAVPRGID